ncbi:MAG: hypothetical protein H6Q74_943 [Firmicutes bacterium]|nr:hypothetical protein [Bacillota bacterium]
MAHRHETTTSPQSWRHRRLNIKHIFSSSVGAMLSIGAVAYLSSITGIAFLMPPLGATCFIAFVIPDSAFAQPRNIIGGHLLSSIIGMLCAYFFGVEWWSYAVAVSMAIAVMQILRVLHPPAAADPLLLIMQGTISWDILITPILSGSVILVVFAILFNKFIAKHRYFRIILFYISRFYAYNANRFC